MRILGIESSCDETAASIIVEDGERLLSNVVNSQIDIHAEYGVIPEIAARSHLEVVNPVIKKFLFCTQIALWDAILTLSLTVTCHARAYWLVINRHSPLELYYP